MLASARRAGQCGEAARTSHPGTRRATMENERGMVPKRERAAVTSGAVDGGVPSARRYLTRASGSACTGGRARWSRRAAAGTPRRPGAFPLWAHSVVRRISSWGRRCRQARVRSWMTIIRQAIGRAVAALLALPPDLGAAHLDPHRPLARLEVWGRERPTLVRVPDWRAR